MRWSWVIVLVGCGRIGFEPLDGGDGDALDAGQCPPGYGSFGPSCYRVQELPALSWSDAEAACEADAVGAHLAVPDDLAELVVIRDEVMSPSITDALIGISDRIVAGTYRAVTGGIAFTLWESGEPDGGVDRCVALGTTAMRDKECDVGNDFVCEYDGIVPDPSAF